jgi:hypothetical protein
VLSVRPKVAELVFNLYGRALHPELFVIHNQRTIQRGEYEATISITSAGHVITWRYHGLTLTEVATAAHHPLPRIRRLMNHKLNGSRTDQMECRGGATYRMNFSLEPFEPRSFFCFQQQLCDDSRRRGMLHRFDSSGRIALGALSYINVEHRNKLLAIQAFHTFPDDYAIVKTESAFQVP